MKPAIESIKGGLIVSVQASDGEPLNRPDHILALSLSGLAGGACGLRLEGLENIAHVRKSVGVPIIGLVKSRSVPESERIDRAYITVTLMEGMQVAGSGADIIAVDASARPRGDGLPLSMTIEALHSAGKAVCADVSTLEEGKTAAACGADIVSTTLYGYTRNTFKAEGEPPDFELLDALIKALAVPVILEGRVWHTQEVTRAFQLGAHAVVVGSAITRPHLITRRFVAAISARPASP